MLCLQSPVTQPGNPNSRGAALRMRVAGQPWQQLSEAPERTVLLSFPSVARELLVVFVFKDLLFKTIFVGVCLSMCVCAVLKETRKGCQILRCWSYRQIVSFRCVCREYHLDPL